MSKHRPARMRARQFLVALGRLENWFQKQMRTLPWRENPSLYRVWISEIMLQQTQVATVIPYFERFIARFPELRDLAAASEEEVMQYWAGLGYYSRARNLHRAARVIFHSGFPKDRTGWLEIPGVGEYTAGAILSIARDQPEAILDGNVERVLARVFRTSDKDRLWSHSRNFVETAAAAGIRPSILNQGLMELGATLCSPKEPVCALCPIAPICSARSHAQQAEYPRKRTQKAWVKVQEELHCLVDLHGFILLRKSGVDEWRAGLWDLPDAKQARRWIPKTERALMGLIETRHVVTHHKIIRTTHVWKIRRKLSSAAGNPLQWVPMLKIDVPVGSALQRTLRKIQETFPEALPED